ncbi:MAG: hypothetical protein LBL52_03965 [Rickettsiales bacterium]|jgi:hypothetical protein|nr:hypothetical protein [Rickettsiales bacterium]
MNSAVATGNDRPEHSAFNCSVDIPAYYTDGHCNDAGIAEADLAKHNINIDWNTWRQVPGITAANTETCLGCAAIYRWKE